MNAFRLLLVVLGLAAAGRAAVQEPAALTNGTAKVELRDPMFESRMYRALRQADGHAGKGQWGEAQAILVDLLEKAPENLLLIEKSAMVLQVQEKWPQALDQWNHLFAKAPTRYDALTRIGQCHARLGKLEEAAKNLELATQLSPAPLEPRFWLAAVQAGMGLTNESARTIGLLGVRDTSLFLHWLASDAAALRTLMGTPVFLDLGTRVLAGGEEGNPFRMATIPEPEWVPHFRKCSLLLMELEHRMEARESTRASELWHELKGLGVDGPMFRGYRAVIVARQQGRAAADPEFQKLIQAHPRHAPLRHLHGVMLLEARAFDDAVPVLREAAHASGNRVEVAFGLACALAGARREEEAMILLSTLADREPAALLNLLQQGAESLANLRLQPQYSDLVDRLRQPATTAP